MVLLKMLMKIGLPKMRGLLVMTMASISPSGREVPPAESLHRRAKVLLPKFRLKATVLLVVYGLKRPTKRYPKRKLLP